MWDQEGRVCRKCNQYLPWKMFSKKSSKRYGKTQTELNKIRQPRCKTCAAEDTKLWKEAQAPERLKDLYYKRMYGLSLEEFQERWDTQNGLCLLCTRALQKSHLCGDSVVVDHCHATGKIRGLLCNECNRGLGYFKDNVMTLKNAIKYLTEEEQSPEGGY